MDWERPALMKEYGMKLDGKVIVDRKAFELMWEEIQAAARCSGLSTDGHKPYINSILNQDNTGLVAVPEKVIELVDDIDTASDMFKPEASNYYHYVHKKVTEAQRLINTALGEDYTPAEAMIEAAGGGDDS